MGRRYVIADTGFTFITAEWEPDPERIQQALVTFADAFEDWSVPMEEARQASIASVRRRFDTETDPSGTPWPELNPDYEEWKINRVGSDKGMLRLTDDMYNATLAGESWIITPRTIEFNAESLPFYAGYHQTGLENRKTPLPQRMFVGLDEEAGLDIQAIFTKWTGDLWDEIWFSYIPGYSIVTTSKGFMGTYTGIAAMGGGSLVRGFIGGHFVKGVIHETGEYRSVKRTR